jgi:uncharacterized membrane protein YbhN (UPF0104 family)
LERKKIKKLTINVAKIPISIALLFLVFRKIPFQKVAGLWKNVNILYLFLAALFFLVSQIISVKRLESYLYSCNFRLSFWSNLELYFLGMFYNFFIPGGIGGDAYKIYLLNKKFGWNAKKLTSAIFNDRLSGLLAICVLALVLSIPLFEVKFSVLIFALIFAGIFLTFFVTKKLFSDFRAIFFRTFFISLLIQSLQVICFIFLLKSLGLNSDFLIYGIVFLCSSVLSLISFSGIGVREILFLQASKYFHFMPQISVSASLLFTIITAFFSIFGVIFQLRKLNLKLSESQE